VASPYGPPTAPLKSRVVYAAAHVVGDPFAEHGPGARAEKADSLRVPDLTASRMRKVLSVAGIE